MLTKQEIQALINVVGSVQVRLVSEEAEIFRTIYQKLVTMLNTNDVAKAFGNVKEGELPECAVFTQA